MGKETFRQRYPMAAVSLSDAENKELAAAAVARGFRSRRGPRIGGFVRALLDGLWPFLRSVEFDPSRCDIPREHAWLLGEMLAARRAAPARWADAMEAAAAALGVDPPPHVTESVAGARPALRKKGAQR